MVLKNSKWDKKAKYLYMKKHGISAPKKDNTPKPKWTSKTADGSKRPERITLEDSDSEWDSDADDALLNHFYPQLGETELSKDQKLKIKQQIMAQIEKEEQDQDTPVPQQLEERDGIYLGSKENQELEEKAKESTQTINLREILAKASNPTKTRKALKAKISDNFLEEYGLDSYQSITRHKDDYNDLYEKSHPVNVMELSSSQLDGFMIGSSVPTNQKPESRVLTQEEIDEDRKREEKAKESRLYDEIRTKFNSKPPTVKSKVLDLNNYDSKNESHVSALNARITANSSQAVESSLDDDLDL
ncbi:uncharacterized protein CANTADRAFT_29125, partial [Suhomyces tanzawaensis NRRL Y-17324]